MSKPWKRTPQTVHRRSVGAPILWCLRVSTLTGVMVFHWGHGRWRPVKSAPAYTATAYAVEGATSEITAHRDVAPAPSPSEWSDEGPSLARRAGVPSNGTENSPHPNPLPKGEWTNGATRTPFTAADDNPERAARAANGLAEGYVSSARAEWQRRTDAACAAARQAAESARRQLAQCEAELQACRQQMVETARRQATPKPQPMATAPTIDNPQWVALDDELSGLHRRQEELLKIRTPLHPAVQEVARRIVGVERQLAATARQIPNPEAGRAVENRPSAIGEKDEQYHAERDEYIEKIAELTRARERARRECQEAELGVQEAMRRQTAGAPFSVEPAQLVRNPAKFDYGWWRLLCTSVAAGLVMALGTSSFTLAIGVETPVDSIARVQAEMGEPVVGIIPADDPVGVAAKVGRRKQLRRVAIVVGLLLIAVCPVLAVWGILGI